MRMRMCLDFTLLPRTRRVRTPYFPPPASWAWLPGKLSPSSLRLRNSSPTPAPAPPASICSQVLQWAHSSKLTCHPRFHRTLQFLRQSFWWPSMHRDTRQFIAACSVCARGKASHQPPAGLLHPLPVPSRPWSHIALEFVTGLPPSEGNTLILTVCP